MVAAAWQQQRDDRLVMLPAMLGFKGPQVYVEREKTGSELALWAHSAGLAQETVKQILEALEQRVLTSAATGDTAQACFCHNLIHMFGLTPHESVARAAGFLCCLAR
jgi:hypothetical protein